MKLLNLQGASTTKVIGIVIIVLLLIGGTITLFNDVADKSVKFSEEEVTITFEKHNESDVYVLLKLQPHETYETLSRVLIQIFDKENGAMITEIDNVLNWKDK